MNPSPAQIESEWKEGKFRTVYLLVGEDASAKEEAVDRLKAAAQPGPLNLDEFPGDSPKSAAAAVSSAMTPPLLSGRRLVVVKNPRLPAEARRVLADYLQAPLETTTLVLFSEDRKPDPRDPLAAAAEERGAVVTFRPMRPDEAARRLARAAEAAGRRLEAGTADFIVDEAGTDWAVLRAELEKMVLFTKGKDLINREDALHCLGYRQAANPFDLPRALQARDREQSLRLLRRLLEEGEEPFRLLHQISSALDRQLRAKRMKAASVSEDRIFRDLRLQPYYDRDFLKWAEKTSEAALIAQLKACLRVEAALKSQTWLDAGTELERLTAWICGARPIAA